MELTSLKDCYRIERAWRDLGLPGEPRKVCRSPFPGEHKHGDANPSFSVFDDGRRWRDFATGESGTVIDLIAKARGCDLAGAIRFVEDRLGIPRSVRKPDAAKKSGAKIPPLRHGSESELRELAERRAFSVEALRLAERRGFLRFSILWGHPAWAVTDSRRLLFEFRRLDGRPWEAYGRLPQRKSHCLGQGKNWPLGVSDVAPFEKVVVCEGSPDALAAHHLAILEDKTESVGIVCVLGASNHHLAPEALRHLAGKRITLYPHLDPAGQMAARHWALGLRAAGAASVVAFDLSGMDLLDGTAGKDLCDLLRLDPHCWETTNKFRGEILP